MEMRAAKALEINCMAGGTRMGCWNNNGGCSWIWIIILLILFCGGNNGYGYGGNNCGGNSGCGCC